jgi:Cd2+/Zn2+-exporting ATPase/Cu+-exporting ATPase
VVVFFMRVGDYAEHFTTERGRGAVRDLMALAPRTARVSRDGTERQISLDEVRLGETVIVRPGEQIPIDGEVIAGHATIDQAAITGESVLIDAGPGTRVYAATLASLGSLRVRATGVGADTTFGRIIKLVEEAESNGAEVQRLADRFATYFLPLVGTIAALTFLLRRDPLATAAVLVVACSCSLALATPIAMLASVGAAAKQGLLIKGGKYLETLARADVLLIDKTGTLTVGRPRITDVVPLNGLAERDILTLAASAERHSEHPLAEAVRIAAADRGLRLAEPEQFEALPGRGVRASVDGHLVSVGNHRLVDHHRALATAAELEKQGKTTLLVARDGEPAGVLAAADTMRPEVPAALAAARALGITHVELVTGDNERVAAALARQLGIAYRANLLPEDKIAVMQSYQAKGHVVVMVGDGVNDAPALAQADVGIAMGEAGTAVAAEAAHLVLMRDDWALVPEALQVARRTMRVVKLNIGFTAVYNVVGLSLAAFGFLPPIVAAAAQSLPDIGILANSSRLLRYRPGRSVEHRTRGSPRQ